MIFKFCDTNVNILTYLTLLMKHFKSFGSDGFSCHCQTAQEHYKNMKEDYEYQVSHNFPREQQEKTYKQLGLARERMEGF